jgi:hypothetical protein
LRSSPNCCGNIGISKVTGDRYALQWVQEPFRIRGITYQPADTKDQLFANYTDEVALGAPVLFMAFTLEEPPTYSCLVLGCRTAGGHGHRHGIFPESELSPA